MVERVIDAITRARELIENVKRTNAPHVLNPLTGPFSHESTHQPHEDFFTSRVVLRNHPLIKDIEIQANSFGSEVQVLTREGSKIKPDAALLAKLAQHGIKVDRIIHQPVQKKKGRLPKEVIQTSIYLTKEGEDIGSIHYAPPLKQTLLMLEGKHAEELIRHLLT